MGETTLAVIMGELDNLDEIQLFGFDEPNSNAPLPPPRPTYEVDDYLSLSDIKDHLSIELSNTDHDSRLTRLAKSAYAWAIIFLNRPLHLMDDNSPPTSPLVIPEDLKTALLLHIEAYFERDPLIMTMLLTAAENLAYPYRISIGV